MLSDGVWRDGHNSLLTATSAADEPKLLMPLYGKEIIAVQLYEVRLAITSGPRVSVLLVPRYKPSALVQVRPTGKTRPATTMA